MLALLVEQLRQHHAEAVDVGARAGRSESADGHVELLGRRVLGREPDRLLLRALAEQGLLGLRLVADSEVSQPRVQPQRVARVGLEHDVHRLDVEVGQVLVLQLTQHCAAELEQLCELFV